MTQQAKRQDALLRATTGQSLTNYPAIIRGFLDRGIPEEDIRPRENVFTVPAWNALGRMVKKGEHGIRVLTVREYEEEDKDGETVIRSVPSSSTVFHIGQTVEMEAGKRSPKKGSTS